ncbi:MAG: alpha/beta fold hydrolase [Pseudomonadota bacterium]|nr:alpha/beta fold hydrolase [Pseudomonadota bacterium]
MKPSGYRAPWWLRSGHVQTMLGSSPWRQRRGARALAATGAVTTLHVLDGGEGVRLQGLHSIVPGLEPRGLALLLHGWEGSAESSYMRLTAARLLQRGYATFRLNLRDHGDSHHLNQAIFHSGRIDEVVLASLDVARRFWPQAGPDRPLVAAGYSLGGNFALRLALRAPAAGLPLAAVAAVCPVLDPAATMAAMESGWRVYLRHFERKWRGSLQRKRALFPQALDFDDRTLRLGMRELTRWLVERHTDFGTLENYFDGYSIAGARLSPLAVPAHILTSADDPVIPVAGFHALALPPSARLEIAAQGGHCGFLFGAGLEGYAEDWVADRLIAKETPA